MDRMLIIDDDVAINESLRFAFKDKYELFFASTPQEITNCITHQNIDIILMPLVAFDTNGNRIGSGAGYYDRTFSFLRDKNRASPYLIGLAFELQKISQIVADPWDVPLNLIVTEKKVYEILAHEI